MTEALNLKYFDELEKMLWKWVYWQGSNEQWRDLYLETLIVLGAIDAARNEVK